ncbi:hypothetical protein ABZ744_20580 [Micromonospora chersina]|uniref:hypothetical protein n=1 Tax=Micromonospora chersina TaxID=47854 RepID=UPI0033C2051C
MNGSNPYTPRELDPLRRPDDFDQLLDLDGFVRVEAIAKHLQAAIEQERPAFLVVSGRNHTGRTSVANCILHLYREMRGLGECFLPGRITVTNNNDAEWLGRALVQLQNEGDFRDIDFSKRTREALGRLEDFGASAYEQRFQKIAFLIARDLAQLPEPHGFGVLFEGVPTATLIATARTVFERAAGIIVFTHDDYEHARTSMTEQVDAVAVDDAIHLVHLRPLVSEQINELATQRWSAASQLDCPYDPEGIEEVFRNSPVPIKVVLHRLATLLDYRLRANHTDEPWPENEHLSMRREWLVATLALLDDRPLR